MFFPRRSSWVKGGGSRLLIVLLLWLLIPTVDALAGHGYLVESYLERFGGFAQARRCLLNPDGSPPFRSDGTIDDSRCEPWARYDLRTILGRYTHFRGQGAYVFYRRGQPYVTQNLIESGYQLSHARTCPMDPDSGAVRWGECDDPDGDGSPWATYELSNLGLGKIYAYAAYTVDPNWRKHLVQSMIERGGSYQWTRMCPTRADGNVYFNDCQWPEEPFDLTSMPRPLTGKTFSGYGAHHFVQDGRKKLRQVLIDHDFHTQWERTCAVQDGVVQWTGGCSDWRELELRDFDWAPKPGGGKPWTFYDYGAYYYFRNEGDGSHPRRDIYGMGVTWARWVHGGVRPFNYDGCWKNDDQEVCDQFNRKQMDFIREAGGTAGGVSFDWYDIEFGETVKPEKRNWDLHDQQVNDLLARGLTSYTYIGNSPPWAAERTDIEGWRSLPKEDVKEDFEQFCYDVAARYRGKVERFFFWNEPNGCSLGPEPCGADDEEDEAEKYTKWLIRCSKKIKQANPHAEVGAGVLECTDQTLSSCLDFLEEMYRQKDPDAEEEEAEPAKHFWDAIVIHPYDKGRVTEGLHWEAICRTYDVMRSHEDGHKEIWLKEWGWEKTRENAHWIPEVLDRLKEEDYGCQNGTPRVTMTNFHQLLDLDDGKWGLCARGPKDIDCSRNAYGEYKSWREENRSLP